MKQPECDVAPRQVLKPRLPGGVRGGSAPGSLPTSMIDVTPRQKLKPRLPGGVRPAAAECGACASQLQPPPTVSVPEAAEAPAEVAVLRAEGIKDVRCSQKQWQLYEQARAAWAPRPLSPAPPRFLIHAAGRPA